MFIVLRILLVSIVLFVFQSNSYAALKLPDALQGWSDWVLRDVPELNCPFVTGDSGKQCSWISELSVTSNQEGAIFELSVKSFTTQESKITLPGDETNWPKEVLLDGKLATVVGQNSMPVLTVTEGEHHITGKFAWTHAPQTLAVPENVGLVTLNFAGKPIANPIIQQGQLTLNEGAEESIAPLQNSLTMKVFRQLKEDVPIRLETRVQLDISGRAREVNLGTLAPSNTQLETIHSDLPARVDNNGNLIVQAKPGSWRITANSRFVADIQRAGPTPQAENNENWPADEIWTYEPNPAIRTLSFSNVDTLDTQQTDLPAEWKNLTAWKLKQNETLQWTVQSRGAENSQANKLNLVREAWLDFSGEAWTIRDSINGSMYSDWHLVLAQPYQLGSVSHDDVPLVVVNYERGHGVELRNQNVAIKAMSRIDARQFNTGLGWINDFESAQMKLVLPPGWSVFAASGANSANPTWISRWNLWDIFWILLIVVASTRLIGWSWGVVSAFVLILNYHEPNAPVWIWMALIISAALLKVVDHPNWRKFFILIQAISALVLALIVIPYSIQQIRQAIYPQLENKQSYYGKLASSSRQVEEANYVDAEMAPTPAAAPAQSLSQEALADKMEPEQRRLMGKVSSLAKPAPKRKVLEKPDQAAQTGPAAPEWNWHLVNVRWSGPVQPNEVIKLWLISPTIERIVSVLRVTGIFLFAFGLLKGVGRFNMKSTTNVILSGMVLLCAFLFAPIESHADVPTNQMLKELKTELTKPPECLPDCLGNSDTLISVTKTNLDIKQKLQSSASLAVKLPSFTNAQLQSVRLDGKSAILQRNEDQLYVWIPEGSHELNVQAHLLNSEVGVTFAYSPHNVRVVAQDWTFEGLVENRLPNNLIKFEYVEKNKDETTARFAATEIAPFAKVERVINFGLEWTVTTRVIRIAPENGAISLKVPLLSGEHVLSEGLVVEDNAAIVNIRPDDSKMEWESKLDLTEHLQLIANTSPSYFETWQFNPSSYWRVEFQGLPPIGAAPSTAQNSWQPIFMPLPDEKLIAAVHSLKPTEGTTLTFDRVNIQIQPGDRMTRTNLSSDFRATRGGEQEITLPENSVIESVKMDGTDLPRIDAHANPKLSFTPGKHRLDIKWKNEIAMSVWTQSLPITFKQAVSNISIDWRIPTDRWVLFVSGAKMGPAVLFWGTFVLVIAMGVLLGKSELTPVSTLSWIILGAGLSTTSLWVGILIVAWFVLLQWRGKNSRILAETPFNFMQLIIVFLTVIMAFSLVFSVPKSLLGMPDMGITGNGSHASNLKWYHDMVMDQLPQVWVISLPMWVYRLSMLVWALWLAFKFIDWLRWGWTQFTQNGSWKQSEKKPSKRQKEIKDSKGIPQS